MLRGVREPELHVPVGIDHERARAAHHDSGVVRQDGQVDLDHLEPRGPCGVDDLMLRIVHGMRGRLGIQDAGGAGCEDREQAERERGGQKHVTYTLRTIPLGPRFGSPDRARRTSSNPFLTAATEAWLDLHYQHSVSRIELALEG